MRAGLNDRDGSDDDGLRPTYLYPDTPPGGVPTSPAAEAAYNAWVRRIPVNQATGKSSILGYQRAINGPDMDHSGISRYEWKLACLLTGDCPGAELEDFLVMGNTMFPTISGPNHHQFEQYLEASGFLSHVLRHGCLKKRRDRTAVYSHRNKDADIAYWEETHHPAGWIWLWEIIARYPQ